MIFTVIMVSFCDAKLIRFSLINLCQVNILIHNYIEPCRVSYAVVSAEKVLLWQLTLAIFGGGGHRQEVNNNINSLSYMYSIQSSAHVHQSLIN